MKKQYLIGVDVGTQGTKAAIYSADGRLCAAAFRPSRLINPAPGIVEQDPDDIYQSLLDAVREAVEKAGAVPGDIAAIGLDGQMAGVLGIDRDFNAVTPYDSWLDTRCGKYIDHIKSTAEDLVIRLTGCPVVTAHGPKMLWWKNEQPEAWRRIDKFLVPTAYLAGRLCGLKAEEAHIDYTQIHFSGFADVQNGVWSDELIRLFDMDENKLPRIVKPWDVCGRLTEAAASRMGLAAGIPVVAGCGDQSATSLGAGVTQAGTVFDVAGTASVFSCCVDRYAPDTLNKTILFARSVLEGLWTPLAYISGGGLCLRWFRDSVAGGALTYDQLNDEAGTVAPGSDGLLFVPHFSGRTCPNDPALKGTWIGLDWLHDRRHLYRSIMESVAYEYGHYLKLIRGLMGDMPVSHVVAIGGGSRSRLFNSIKASVLGIPYAPLDNGDTATWGSAVIAGYGVGVYRDIPTAVAAAIAEGSAIAPEPESHKLYAGRLAAYEKLYGPLHQLYSSVRCPEL